MTFEKYNANPENKNIGDCSIRAICTATPLTYQTIFSNKNNNSPRRTRELLLLLFLPNRKHNFERRFALMKKIWKT